MIDILLLIVFVLICIGVANVYAFAGVRESLELVNKRLGQVLDDRAQPVEFVPHPVTGRQMNVGPQMQEPIVSQPLRKKAHGWQAAKNALEQASREPELKREETIRKNEEVLRG